MAIVTRASKGSALTHAELDNNFAESGRIVASGYITNNTSVSRSNDGDMQSAHTIAPSMSGTKLIVVANFNCRSSSAGAGDMGMAFSMRYYTGSSYQSIPSSQRSSSSPIVTSGSNYVTNYDYDSTANFVLYSSDVRTDNGSWTFRLYGSSIYSSTTSVYGSSYVWFEVLE